METMSYSHLRKSLASALDKVNEDHAPLLITRSQGKAAVLMSLEDFNSYAETAYLLASPRNAQRLAQALNEVSQSQTLPHDLQED